MLRLAPLLVILSACASAPPPPSQSARDPSNPHAEETAALVYACPMHPEVTSSAPGHCPKCAMELVPREEAR